MPCYSPLHRLSPSKFPQVAFGILTSILIHIFDDLRFSVDLHEECNAQERKKIMVTKPDQQRQQHKIIIIISVSETDVFVMQEEAKDVCIYIICFLQKSLVHIYAWFINNTFHFCTNVEIVF